MNLWILLLCAATFASKDQDNPFTAEGKRLAKKANPRHQPGLCSGCRKVGWGIFGLFCWYARDYSCGAGERLVCNYNYFPTLSTVASGAYSYVPSLKSIEKAIDDKKDNKNDDKKDNKNDDKKDNKNDDKKDNNAQFVTFCGENASEFRQYMFGGETYEDYCLEKYTTDCGKYCGEGDEEVRHHSSISCKSWSNAKRDCEKKTKAGKKTVVVGQDGKSAEGKNNTAKNTSKQDKNKDNTGDKQDKNKDANTTKKDSLRLLQEKPIIRSASNKL